MERKILIVIKKKAPSFAMAKTDEGLLGTIPKLPIPQFLFVYALFTQIKKKQLRS